MHSAMKGGCQALLVHVPPGSLQEQAVHDASSVRWAEWERAKRLSVGWLRKQRIRVKAVTAFENNRAEAKFIHRQPDLLGMHLIKQQEQVRGAQ